MNRRLRNAAIASSVVALAQQLSGINIMAFYGGSVLVQGVGVNRRLSDDEVYKAMVYNVIFGLLNFLFCLPAIRYVDTLGRRRILLFTIPGMALGLMAAAVSFNRVKVEVVAWWLYCKSAPKINLPLLPTPPHLYFNRCFGILGWR